METQKPIRKKNRKRVSLNLTLPPTVIKDIKETCKAHGIPVSRMAEMMLETFQMQKAIRNTTIPNDLSSQNVNRKPNL